MYVCRRERSPKRRSAVVALLCSWQLVWPISTTLNCKVFQKLINSLCNYLKRYPESLGIFFSRTMLTLSTSDMPNRLPPLSVPSIEGRNQCSNHTTFDMADLPPAAGRKVILTPLSIAPVVEAPEPLSPRSFPRSAQAKKFKLRPISPTDSISSLSSQDLLKKALCRENSDSFADDNLRDVSIPSKSLPSSSPSRVNGRRHLERHVSDISMDSSLEEPLWEGDI